MRKHVAHGAGALAFKRSEHVIKFQRAAEQARHRIASTGLLDGADLTRKQSQAEELTLVEHFVPKPVPVVQHLVRIVPRLYAHDGIEVELLSQACRRFLIQRAIEIIGTEIQLLALTCEDHFRVETVTGRMPLAFCRGSNPELGGARWTHGLRPHRRSSTGVEGIVATVAASG